MNAFFQKCSEKKWTWRSPNWETKNEIDYILTNKKNLVTDVEVITELDIGSDHRPVGARVMDNKFKRKSIRKKKYQPSSSFISLNKEEFEAKLNEVLRVKSDSDVGSKLNDFNKALLEATDILEGVRCKDFK